MSNEHYAHGAERAAIEAVMRLSAVKRWHMIDTTRTQNLAEHSANVASLAYLIAVTAPSMYFGPAFHVAAHALLHDFAEVFTGDIPSHTKKHLSGVKDLEDRLLPDVLVPAMPPDRQVKQLIKLCDLADGVRFIRLHGVDVTAEHAREGLDRQLGNLLIECYQSWPTAVHAHVTDLIAFYVHEKTT